VHLNSTNLAITTTKVYQMCFLTLWTLPFPKEYPFIICQNFNFQLHESFVCISTFHIAFFHVQITQLHSTPLSFTQVYFKCPLNQRLMGLNMV
jgi:hypothetical protein